MLLKTKGARNSRIRTKTGSWHVERFGSQNPVKEGIFNKTWKIEKIASKYPQNNHYLPFQTKYSPPYHKNEQTWHIAEKPECFFDDMTMVTIQKLGNGWDEGWKFLTSLLTQLIWSAEHITQKPQHRSCQL